MKRAIPTLAITLAFVTLTAARAQTATPAATATPVATESPDATAKPVVPQSPDATATPAATASPAATPEATPAPTPAVRDAAATPERDGADADPESDPESDADADAADDDVAAPEPSASRPPVAGGIYDKPFITRLGGGTALGGYADFQARHRRTDGIVEDLNIVPERFNLFTFSSVSDRVRVAAEIEIEEMGAEIHLETAIIDFEIHEALVLRAGVILSPLGRFNLAHDSPANDLVERPLVSTDILAATLSEPGGGVWGAVYPFAEARVSWEAYLVNGFDEGVVLGSPDGTRIAEGKGSFEDANASPAFVGRLAVSPLPWAELGLSGHRGTWNTWRVEGETVDARRDLTIAAADFEVRRESFAVVGEAARAWINVPPGLAGLAATRQEGWYLEGRYRFGAGLLYELPESFFVAALRLERVDFDLDRNGDDVRRGTAGVSFRPTPDTAFKLDLALTRSRDRFAIDSASTSVLAGVTTYF